MGIILTSHYEKNLSITPEIEESGNILGKDLWVMGPLKEITVEKIA